jgi:murein DD-endopeptidase MepM/ murein hydrolase activator NlpD
VRAVPAAIAVLALSAAFLLTAGTSRAGVRAEREPVTDADEKAERVALVRAARERRLAREHRRAVRRLHRELAHQAEGAWWTAVAARRPFVCPVSGPHRFTNDWGTPRSGGRRHAGNDMMASYGTPVVASVDGIVTGTASGSGGVTFELVGDDGNTYVGMHLSRLSGASGRVAQGEVLGYVGTSGNARGGSPHLHFEIHPGGGSAVNPYPTLVTYC